MRFVKEGRLEVRTPALRMLAGELTPGKVYTLGGLRISTPTRVAGLLALSLDGKPLERSRHFAVKMVSRAENTGEVLARAPGGAVKSWQLAASGRAPVITRGKTVSQPTRLWVGPSNSAPLLALWMENGTWEIESRDGHLTLICDTPGISGKLAGRSLTTSKEEVAIAPQKSPSP